MKKTAYLYRMVFPLVVLIFLIRTWFWAMGDISHDEALTIGMYCRGLDGDTPPFLSVFRNYTLANNHILSTACYWLWLNIVPWGASSMIVRLPSMLFAVLTLLVVSVGWRPWLGKRWAALGGVLLASSSIYAAFAYQVRGYSLTMLLSALSVTAMLKLISTRGKEGQFLLCLTLFLHPLVMPSSAILAPVIALVMTLVFFKQKFALRTTLAIVLPGLLSAGLSSAYYLTLGAQLEVAAENARRNVGFLWNRWTAYGNVLLAFAVHAGILLVPLAKQLWKPDVPSANRGIVPDAALSNRDLILILLGVMLLLITGMYLLSPPELLPFPRNALVFLPLFTFTILLAGREQRFLGGSPILLVCGILLQGFLADTFFSWRSRQLIEQGMRPLSLTMQLYRGANEFTRIAQMFKEIGLQPQTLIITQDFDLATLLWHMSALGLDTANVHSPKTIQGGMFHTRSGNLPVLIIAQTDARAHELLQGVRLDPKGCSLLQAFGRRGLYVLK